MKSQKRIDVRGDDKSRRLGTLAGYLMKAWSVSLRYEIIDHHGITTPGGHDHPVIFALWHNRILTLPPIWHRTGGNQRNSVVLTSASKDGGVLASAMAVFGIGAVRGSSHRRAVAALIGMKRALKDGFDVCITPDGPRGPRYQCQPGAVKLAESAKVPIIPVHATYSRAWRLKTWDRLVIPMPFSKVRVTFGKMISIPFQPDPESFEAERVRLESILLNGTDDL
jgi:lysophospholipid acyltransferase (LPLAT)-like uncharacterized protein